MEYLGKHLWANVVTDCVISLSEWAGPEAVGLFLPPFSIYRKHSVFFSRLNSLVVLF